jgi:hypothetical protein
MRTFISSAFVMAFFASFSSHAVKFTDLSNEEIEHIASYADKSALTPLAQTNTKILNSFFDPMMRTVLGRRIKDVFNILSVEQVNQVVGRFWGSSLKEIEKNEFSGAFKLLSINNLPAYLDIILQIKKNALTISREVYSQGLNDPLPEENRLNYLPEEIRNSNAERLFLNGNKIKNIKIIKNLKNVTHLSINQSPIKDISFLKDFKNLKYLYVEDTDIQDITFLLDLPNLKTISFSHKNPLLNRKITQEQWDRLTQLGICLPLEVVEKNLARR